MRARYPGKCFKCGESFPAGTAIDYTKRAPRGKKTAHADCENPTADFYADAPSAARGVSYEPVSDVFVIGGNEFYRNRKGTCIDAP